MPKSANNCAGTSRSLRVLRGAAAAMLALWPALAGAQSILVAGAETPFKMAATPGGNFVLAESGTGNDDGRVSLLSLWGDRFPLLEGLPSAPSSEGAPSGPTAVAQTHRTVYVALGSGDAISETQPPHEIPNPEGPSSPIFSSILRARFDPVPDSIREGFELGADHVASLADGHQVVLENESGETVELLLLADFRDLHPDPITTVRPSNPFAAAIVGSLTPADVAELAPGLSPSDASFLARLEPDSALGRRLEERSALYVVDSAQNAIQRIDPATGRSSVHVRFPPVANPLFPALGGPVTDAVPTGIHPRADGDLLVSFLTGFPFATGAARVMLVDGETGVFTPYLDGLTAATDVLEVGGVTYVLEFSTSFLQQAPGRVLRFDTAAAAPVVVADGLIGPSALAYDPFRNELLVSEAFTGRIVRVALD